MPADAAQARLAAQLLIVRELADTLAGRATAADATVEQMCRLGRGAAELVRTATQLERTLARHQQKPVAFFGTVAADAVDVAALDAVWCNNPMHREAAPSPSPAAAGETAPAGAGGPAPAGDRPARRAAGGRGRGGAGRQVAPGPLRPGQDARPGVARAGGRRPLPSGGGRCPGARRRPGRGAAAGGVILCIDPMQQSATPEPAGRRRPPVAARCGWIGAMKGWRWSLARAWRSR